MLDFICLALGLAFFASMIVYTAATERMQERAMEPVFGLAVAVALGIYLLITLLHPERF